MKKGFVERALRKRCPDIIPRTGEEAEKMDCYSVRVDKANEPFLLVEGIEGDKVNGALWNGARFATPGTFEFRDFQSGEWKICHYYGSTDIRFDSLNNFVFERASRFVYLRVWISRILSKLSQFLFNRKKLVTRQRIKLLNFLLKETFEGRDEFDELHLMTRLYTIRWVLHPEQESQMRKLEFYLMSLTETGELVKVNNHYRLTGQALRAVEEYEEQERRHFQNVRVQWLMVLLTVAIVGLTVVQSGLVKLPLLLDLSKLFASGA